MRGFFGAITIALLVSVTVAAKSDECTKIRGFALALTPVDDGYLLPLEVANTPRRFLLELDAAYTKMDETLAVELKLATKPLPHGMGVADSEGAFSKIAIVPELNVGPLLRKNVEVLIGVHRRSWGDTAEGVAAINIFYGLDVELDLGHNHLGLYLPRPDCQFTPFWQTVEWGSSDFMTAPTGGLYSRMDLDGKEVITTFNTTEERTFMPLESAHRLFGIEESDPRLVPAGIRAANGKPIYRYAFKALSSGHNVTVYGPEIYIVAGEKTCGGNRDLSDWKWGTVGPKCFGGGDLQLGVNLLKKLHFFFSYKDKKLYFTLAEPPPLK
jgi:hypothetical protein